ncbi:hypothetical protein B296_00028421, partial [Ensete ventricosum]
MPLFSQLGERYSIAMDLSICPHCIIWKRQASLRNRNLKATGLLLLELYNLLLMTLKRPSISFIPDCISAPMISRTYFLDMHLLAFVLYNMRFDQAGRRSIEEIMKLLPGPHVDLKRVRGASSYSSLDANPVFQSNLD